jgi:aspartate aminotransferase
VLGLKTPEGKTIVNEQDFALYMLDNGVAGIQGEAYGLSPYVRLSIATDLASLREACQRIQRACAALS